MELLKDDRLLPLAAKYASRLGRMHLAEKLSNLSETWERQSETLNVAQSSHFPGLESQEINEVTNSEQDLNTSLIIPQKTSKKKMESDTTIKPVVSIIIFLELSCSFSFTFQHFSLQVLFICSL